MSVYNRQWAIIRQFNNDFQLHK